MRASSDSWPVLDRLHRASAPNEAPTPPAAADPAARAAGRAPAEAAPPAAARRAPRSLLGRYAAAPAEAAPITSEAARRLPLADVFARLEAGR